MEQDFNNTAVAGFAMIMMLIYFAAMVISIAALWKLFTKAGKPGWAAIIPIYNTIVLLEIVGKPIWWIVLLIIPFANIVFFIIIIHALSKSFGKDVAFTIGLILLTPIFIAILAFSDAKYLGPMGDQTFEGNYKR